MRKPMSIILFFLASLYFMLPAGAAPAPVEATAGPEVALPYGPVPQQPTGRIRTAAESELIDVNFPNDEVRNIIRSVADMNDLNVVIPETLVGNVSIKLRNVTWEQVFDVVLEPLGYTYVKDGNIIKIRSIKELLAEPMQTQVFLVNFAKAAELRAAVAPLVDETLGGRVQVDTRTNCLIVTERSAQIVQIGGIIARLDRPTEQVMIESKFIEVTDNQLTNLGLDWSSLSAFGGKGSFSRTVTRTHDNNEDDVRPNILSDLHKVDTAVLSTDTFSMVLNALRTDDKVQLVSNPTVVTMNNTAANIHIGVEYPIPNYSYNQETGTFEVSGFEFKPIGISLDVIPQVNNTGLINLQIKPEISSKSGTVNFGGASGAEIPIITQRRTSSTVTIKSGFTLAIGGLIETSTGKTEKKVPLLGDIPLLGRLFTTDSDKQDRRNLVIFITAKILDPEGSTYQDIISEKNILDMGLSRSEIPGYVPSAEEKDLYRRIQQARDDAQRANSEARARLLLEDAQRRQAKGK